MAYYIPSENNIDFVDGSVIVTVSLNPEFRFQSCCVILVFGAGTYGYPPKSANQTRAESTSVAKFVL